MVNAEIRRLQMLNDLIAQTLEVLERRTAMMSATGLSHTPYNGVESTMGYGINQAGLFHSPFAGAPSFGVNPYAGVPFVNPIAQQGLSHSPFAGDVRFGANVGSIDPRVATLGLGLGAADPRLNAGLNGTGWNRFAPVYGW